MRTFTSILFAAAIAFAQTPVAPTNEQVGDPKGSVAGDFNITQSFELGYRYATIGGDLGMYKSVANYTDGIRLLSSSVSVDSKDGHGAYFDHIQLNTTGLGGDPYQFASFRIEKNRLYRYDLIWRENDYYNPALTISNGQHFRDTTRTLQDHDLTLFPQSNIKFFLGYSRDVSSGPVLSTVELFDVRGDEYPTFADIREQQNEYRIGTDVSMLGWRLNLMRGWEDYKQDTPTQVFAPEAGNNPTDLNTLTSFNRVEPYHGTSPYWRLGLFHDRAEKWAVNGRFTYVAGNRAFVQNELGAGTNFVGALATQQILAFGTARRPAATGNLNITFFPTPWFTLTNQSSVYNIRTEGDSEFSQFFLGGPIQPVLQYTFLGIFTFSNSTDAEFRLKKKFAVHGGYQYSDRHIDVVDSQQSFGLPAPSGLAIVPFSQVNILQEGTLGFRYRPIQPLAIMVDGELGRNNHPYTPIGDKNYQALRARVEYKRKSFRAEAFAKSDYDNNSISITSFASKSRNNGVNGSWTPNEWFSIDAGYDKMHWDSLGGINFFVANALTSGQSLYISNIHSATLMARFDIKNRADISFGYSHVQDVGDGRSNPLSTCSTIAVGATTSPSSSPCVFSAIPGPGLPFQFAEAQTFPLRFESPTAKLSIRIHKQLRWNVGYQYYGYHEQFSSLQNFRANTGYTSLLFAF